MQDDVIEFGSAGSRIRIVGLGRTVRALEKSGADAQSMRDLMHDLGSIVVRGATPPVASGALQGTIRAGRGKTKAVVRAGTARVPYAGVHEWGNPRTGLPAKHFLSNSLNSNRTDVLEALERGLLEIAAKNGLDSR